MYERCKSVKEILICTIDHIGNLKHKSSFITTLNMHGCGGSWRKQLMNNYDAIYDYGARQYPSWTNAAYKQLANKFKA